MLTYWKTKGKIIDKNTQIQTSIPASAKITATTSPEIELLLCCARTQIDDATAEQINKLVEQEIDWANLLQIADRHRVFPLLTQSLLATCPEAVPPDILARLRHLFHAQGQHNLALTSKLLKILNLFKEHNIDAIPFKGPVLAASAYSNLLLRQNGDLDLLVKESDFQKAIDLLISQGYVQTIQVPWEVHLTYKDGRNSIDLDLHREIVPKPAILILTLGGHFSPLTKNFMTAHNDLKVATTPVQHSFETDTRSLNGTLRSAFSSAARSAKGWHFVVALYIPVIALFLSVSVVTFLK